MTTDRKAVEKAAKKLAKNYGADVDVTDALQQLYDFMESGYRRRKDDAPVMASKGRLFCCEIKFFDLMDIEAKTNESATW